jgi:phospholipid transport system substrate-binding protein
MRFALTLALLFTLFAAQPVLATEPDSRATVEKLHATLIETMQQSGTLGYKGRVQKVDPVLKEVFEFETIARIVTGRFWAGLSAEKRKEFIEVFMRLSAATYADNFDGFGGERFETRTVENKKDAQLVKTALVKTDGKEVALNYLLVKSGGMWRIVNVVAEGVSDLSLKRAEYTAVIGSSGIDALIAKLNAKVASYGSAPTT